jgi:hypothetical protein
MAICAGLGGRCAGLLACADVLARADVLAGAAVLAVATVAVATDALTAVQSAMRPAAARRLPRIVFITGLRINPEQGIKLVSC